VWEELVLSSELSVGGVSFGHCVMRVCGVSFGHCVMSVGGVNFGQ